jgi:hypothetical protein
MRSWPLICTIWIITDQQMEGLERRALRWHVFHGEWNYTLIPQRIYDPR